MQLERAGQLYTSRMEYLIEVWDMQIMHVYICACVGGGRQSVKECYASSRNRISPGYANLSVMIIVILLLNGN